MRWRKQSGSPWKARSAAWPWLMRPMRASSVCIPQNGRPRRPPKGLRPLPRSARGGGARKRRSAAAANAAHAAIDLGVFPPHQLQRLQLPPAGGRLRLAPRRQLRLLFLITGLPFSLGQDEPAILLDRQGRGGADDEGEREGQDQFHRRRPFHDTFSAIPAACKCCPTRDERNAICYKPSHEYQRS